MERLKLQDKKECIYCHTTRDLHRHHIFFGIGLRSQSEKYGLTVYLCSKHHNMSDNSVHFNRQLDLDLKEWAQKKAMKHYGWTEDDFRQRFIRSYI